MPHYGKLFFDFAAPFQSNGQHWDPAKLQEMHYAVETAINNNDAWNSGLCKRNQWLSLWDLPSDHLLMVGYCTTKLRTINTTFEAVEVPPQPIAYCYSGNQRICYHPHAIELNGKLWTVPVSGVPGEIQILIVLSYKETVWP